MKILPSILCCTALVALPGGHSGLWAGPTARPVQPPARFDLMREGEGFTVRVLRPLIPEARLTWLGLAAGTPREGATRIPCWLAVNGAGRRPVDVTLRCSGGYLQSFTLPAIFYDLLGRQNIATVLRLAEGASVPDPILASVTPAMVRTVLNAAGFVHDPRADLITLQLDPMAEGIRSVVVTLKRRAPHEDYKEITVSMRK